MSHTMYVPLPNHPLWSPSSSSGRAPSQTNYQTLDLARAPQGTWARRW